jgi:hypothetical protein
MPFMGGRVSGRHDLIGFNYWSTDSYEVVAGQLGLPLVQAASRSTQGLARAIPTGETTPLSPNLALEFFLDLAFCDGFVPENHPRSPGEDQGDTADRIDDPVVPDVVDA